MQRKKDMAVNMHAGLAVSSEVMFGLMIFSMPMFSSLTITYHKLTGSVNLRRASLPLHVRDSFNDHIDQVITNFVPI